MDQLVESIGEALGTDYFGLREPFTPQQEEAFEALTRGIVNKIAHGPISQLRDHAGQPEGAHVVAAIRKAFHLQD